jgi:hypothetical protein
MQNDKIVTDETGRHRLTMRFTTEGKGGNFHSLIWAVSDGSVWADRVVITRDDFQPPTKHRRWIANLYSFEPDAGRAIIQVAEGDVPAGTLPEHYTYSWREWDIQHNREVRLLSVCKSPFDKYEPSA